MSDPINPSESSSPPEDWPGFEVAIEAEGLTPADVPVRQLAELLEAAAATVEAVAHARGIKVPVPTLVAVRTGSAAYDLRIADPSASPIVSEIEQHISRRGKGATVAVRSALNRLHRAGRGMGGVRFTKHVGREKRAKPLRLGPTVSEVLTPVEMETELHGRVTAVSAGRGETASIRLRLDDGGSQEFSAEREVARLAARLFLRTVRAKVTYNIDDRETPNEIEEIAPWDAIEDEDLLVHMSELRDSMAAHAPGLRASDWLESLEEDS